MEIPLSNFTVRIELHGAVGDDYDRLHKKMFEYKYYRFVSGVTPNGTTGVWALPTAEYDYESTATVSQVRDHAKSIADTIRAGAWCLATQVADRAWSTMKAQ